MNLPQLFGTRRVGPDLIREGGKRTNDWHLAHFRDPNAVVPESVMPRYDWFFEAEGRPNERGWAITAYVQWLGSWRRGEGGKP
jgi:cbb3-type cytochrome oxidase cytochrome c subunit